jgi:TRAP-type C4-dicarboxylate transport system substrate-binding protein
MLKQLKLTTVALTAMASLMMGAAQADQLKYGDYTPQGANEYAKSAEWMGKEIPKRSNNKHSMLMLWGGTVVKVGEVPTAVEIGPPLETINTSPLCCARTCAKAS